MPWSQTPVVSCPLAIAHPGLALSDTLQRVSFHPAQRDYPMTTTIHISGLDTEPASLLPPASDSRYRVCLRIRLLTCWLGFGQVGLSQCSSGFTHWVTITHFIPSWRQFQGFGFTLTRARALLGNITACQYLSISISILQNFEEPYTSGNSDKWFIFILFSERSATRRSLLGIVILNNLKYR